MNFLQDLWDLVPGESLGDKLAVISMASGAVAVIGGGLYAWHRRRKGTDVESRVEDLHERFANLEKELQAQVSAKERAGDSAAPVEASGEGLAKDLSAAIGTLAEAGKTRALELLETGDSSAADAALAEKIAELEAARGKAASGEAALYRQRGALAFLNDTAEAMRHYARACELDPDDPDGWNQLGHLQDRVGNLDAAIASYEKVLALGNSTADKTWIAIATGNLGNVYRTRGDLDRAEEMYRKTLALNEELGRKQGMASDYGNVGIVYSTRGDLDRAEEMYRKSLKIEKELGRKEGMASDYANLGILYKKKGDMAAACAHWRKARDLFTELGAPHRVKKVEGWLREGNCPGE